MRQGILGEIPDPFINKTVPYADPVTKEQNLAGFQLAGQSYYRVIMNIPFGKELLVWYGETYAEEIGIEVGTVGKNTGEEDLTKEAVKCEYCGTEIAGEEKLEEHMGKGVNGKYRCGVKQAKEMVRITEGGERRFVCKVCGKGFKTKQNLSNHSSTHTSTHTKDKAFKCVVEGCTKRYASVGGLLQHKKAVHEGVYYECPKCGKRFARKFKMTEHVKIVHEQETTHKCFKCGALFGQNFNLTRHIRTVHDKIRPFKCEHCDMSFGRADYRKVHIEGVHSNIC